MINKEIILNKCRYYSMSSDKRMLDLIDVVCDSASSPVQGDFVELGVCRGGSCMAMAHTLLALNVCHYKPKIWLYDTFAGLPKPNKDLDIKFNGQDAITKWNFHNSGVYNTWCYAEQKNVEYHMKKTKYLNYQLVKGEIVLNKKPIHLPKKISLLRIDVDWYEGTLASLKHFYPLLSKGGVIILDDYNVWKGANKAANKYFNNDVPKYTRIDLSAVRWKKE